MSFDIERFLLVVGLVIGHGQICLNTRALWIEWELPGSMLSH